MPFPNILAHNEIYNIYINAIVKLELDLKDPQKVEIAVKKTN